MALTQTGVENHKMNKRGPSDPIIMKRRPLPAGASGSMRHAPSQTLAEDYTRTCEAPANVKRRPVVDRRLAEGVSDEEASPAPAPDYGDLAGATPPVKMPAPAQGGPGRRLNRVGQHPGIRGGCDAEPSPPTADYRDSDPKDQDRAYPLAGGRSASRSGASSFPRSRP